MPMSGALTSSKYPHWCTPRWFWKLVEQFFGGQILLDPCSNKWTTVRAKVRLTSGGLDVPWSPATYMNPPYGYRIRPWMLKAHDEVAASGARTIGLIPARTDTTWWHSSVPHAAAVCYVKGRMVFERPRRHGKSWTAGFPSAVVLWSGRDDIGREVRRFRRVFGKIGWIP